MFRFVVIDFPAKISRQNFPAKNRISRQNVPRHYRLILRNLDFRLVSWHSGRHQHSDFEPDPLYEYVNDVLNM